MLDFISKVTAYPIMIAWTCFKLLGHMAVGTYMLQHARLRLRPLQKWLSSVYSPGRSQLVSVLTILPSVLCSLCWWKDPSAVLRGVSFMPPQPLVTLVTDASDLGGEPTLAASRFKASGPERNL